MLTVNILIALAAMILLVHVARADTPQQAQASALAVPGQSPKIVNIIGTTQCSQLVALLLIDEHGGVHPVNLEGVTIARALQIMNQVPADHVMSVDTGCPKSGDMIL
jgi:hypothetical protein